MRKYFKNLNDVAEIKKEYRRLAFLNHPDYNNESKNSTVTMQIINDQYHFALNNCNGQVNVGSDNKEHVYNYNYDIEQELINVINQLFQLYMEDVEIELIGTWLWISGETKKHKEDLKKIKCRWHTKKRCWYFAKKTNYRRHYSKKSLDELRVIYGSSNAKNYQQNKMATI